MVDGCAWSRHNAQGRITLEIGVEALAHAIGRDATGLAVTVGLRNAACGRQDRREARPAARPPFNVVELLTALLSTSRDARRRLESQVLEEWSGRCHARTGPAPPARCLPISTQMAPA
jgi:hypothetical protein